MIKGISDSNQKIVTNGLILNLDASQKRSYSGSGTAWNDLSGNGNHATLINSPTYSTLGGGSILFNGTNSYANGNIQNSSTYTISIWGYNLTNNVIGSSFIGTGTTSPSSVNMFIQIGGSPYPFQFNEAYLPSSTATINQWVMLTAVQNTTTQELYINGTSVNTANGTSIIGDYYNIGRRADGYYLNTYISTAQIHNRSLSATEIQQNYNALKSRFSL